jgi:hypothetical protein
MARIVLSTLVTEIVVVVVVVVGNVAIVHGSARMDPLFPGLVSLSPSVVEVLVESVARVRAVFGVGAVALLTDGMGAVASTSSSTVVEPLRG